MARYSKFFRRFDMEDRKEFPPDNVNVFVGSSTIRHWTTLKQDMAPKPVINRGFGGSTLEELLMFHERLILRYKFSNVFIYEGDNDIGKNPDKIPVVLAQYERLVSIIHDYRPGAGIYILSLKCSPNKMFACQTQKLANEYLREFAAKYPFTHFIDFASGFFLPDGQIREDFFKDGMHPSAKGYEYMTKVIKPYVFPQDL